MMWSQGLMDSQLIPTFQFSKETVTHNSTISICKHCPKVAGRYSVLTSIFTSLRRLLTNSISSVSTGLPIWLNASCGKMSCTEAQFFCAFGCKQQHSASITFFLYMGIVDVHVHVADYYVYWFRKCGICQPGSQHSVMLWPHIIPWLDSPYGNRPAIADINEIKT